MKTGKFAKVILTNKITGGSAGDILRNFYNCPNLKVKRAQSPNRPLLQLGGRGREGKYPQGSWCAAPGNDLKLVFIVALTFYHQFTPPVRVASCNFVPSPPPIPTTTTTTSNKHLQKVVCVFPKINELLLFHRFTLTAIHFAIYNTISRNKVQAKRFLIFSLLGRFYYAKSSSLNGNFHSNHHYLALFFVWNLLKMFTLILIGLK